MKNILIKLSYDIDYETSVSYKWLYLIDFLFIVIYMILSIYNAFSGVNEFKFFDANNNFAPTPTTIKTITTLAFNYILVFRSYLRLFIQWKDEIGNAINVLKKEMQYDKIVVEALEARVRLARTVLILVALLSFILAWFGTIVAQLVAGITVIVVVLSCLNNIIDLLVSMYHAKPRISLLNYIDKGVI